MVQAVLIEMHPIIAVDHHRRNCGTEACLLAKTWLSDIDTSE